MCGRFTLTVARIEAVAAAFDAALDPADAAAYRPRYNVAPGDQHWIVRLAAGEVRRTLSPAGWGLVNHWAPDASRAFQQINARAETLAQRRAYREALKTRRCVVPTDGFYEWYGPPGARRPMWLHPRAGELLALAGLYEHWTNPKTGEVRTTFTVVTTPANALVAPIHDRMPAVLAAAEIEPWLSRGDRRVLHAAPEDALVATRVSRRVNSARNDDPSLLEPEREEDRGGQQRLFGGS
ncbi:MAG: SOS response-associated peptidase [Polyangiaceae bacterium]|nr:SOS response-associated peptidase [Polyangiaceae bacterium]